MSARRPALRVPPAARRFLDPFATLAGRLRLSTYVVGGCVRDWLLGRKTFDVDLVCEGDPSPLAEACARAMRTRAERFGQFGTWRVIDGGGFRVDLVTARRERYVEPAALPLVTPDTLPADLARRDFTVNAMALPLSALGLPPREAAAAVVDPHGGLADLEARRLRALHPGSLRDDPTRAFRAARYAARFGLRPDEDLLGQIRAAVAEGHAERLSPHRLLNEFWRVLSERDPAPALRLLRAWGYLALLHPGLPDPPRAARGPAERLGAMALGLGAEAGADFIAALPLERGLAGELKAALRTAGERRAPRTPLPQVAARALAVADPRLPRSALRPAFLRGQDLRALGLPPGLEFGSLLDEAGRLQWQGRLASRSQALAWLRRRAAK